MKRTVRVNMSFVVRLDDDRESLPAVGSGEPLPDLIAHVARLVVPGAVEMLPGARLVMSNTRETAAEIRRQHRARATASKTATIGHSSGSAEAP